MAQQAHDPEKVTEEALREAALRYLDQRDSSVQQLRKVLQRRVIRHAPPEQAEQAESRIDAILERLQESKLLDDERYARALSESLRRRGGSTQKIRAKLMSRGLAETHVRDALSMTNEGDVDEREGARIYARKRRLLDRYDVTDPKQRQKALAALARQGFSFDVAREVLGL